MVSKARLLLPEPDKPVTTTSLPRGMATSMPLRLCSRAPLTTMLPDILVSRPTPVAGGRFARPSLLIRGFGQGTVKPVARQRAYLAGPASAADAPAVPLPRQPRRGGNPPRRPLRVPQGPEEPSMTPA